MKQLAQRIQPLFLARPRREKILAVLFFVVLAVIWSTWLAGRASAAVRDIAMLRETSRSQAAWLNNEESIESRYGEAMSRLNRTKLPSQSEVMARLEELARKHAVAPFDLRRPISERKEGLTFHTFSMNIQRTGYDQLEAFYNDVESTLPSVNLFEVRISANMNNRSQLTARLSLIAIELNR